MRRIVPLLSAAAFAGVIAAPMLMSTSSVSAAPADAPYCLPHVLPAPLDILEYQRDSYSGSLGLGQC